MAAVAQHCSLERYPEGYPSDIIPGFCHPFGTTAADKTGNPSQSSILSTAKTLLSLSFVSFDKNPETCAQSQEFGVLSLLALRILRPSSGRHLWGSLGAKKTGPDSSAKSDKTRIVNRLQFLPLSKNRRHLPQNAWTPWSTSLVGFGTNRKCQKGDSSAKSPASSFRTFRIYKNIYYIYTYRKTLTS